MASQRQRLLEYHTSRLNDKQTTTRIEAIEQLVLLGAHEALEALQDVFKNDSDNEVRKAAQDAGRKLFRIKNIKPATESK